MSSAIVRLHNKMLFHTEILFSTLKAINIIENKKEIKTDEQEQNQTSNPPIWFLAYFGSKVQWHIAWQYK